MAGIRTLLDYCRDDVRALERLLPRLLDHIDLPRTIHHSRYMKAGARMEHRGVPMDTRRQKGEDLRHTVP